MEPRDATTRDMRDVMTKSAQFLTTTQVCHHPRNCDPMILHSGSQQGINLILQENDDLNTH